MRGLRPGESIVAAGLTLWLAVAVGPWWLAIIIYAVGTVANLIERWRTDSLIRTLLKGDD